jgi:hypothetical protein
MKVLIVALKTELDNVREIHRLESASQEELIKELRLKLEEAEKKSTQDQDEKTAQVIESLQSELIEKQQALEEAQRNEHADQQFRERSVNLEHQIAELVQHSFLKI